MHWRNSVLCVLLCATLYVTDSEGLRDLQNSLFSARLTKILIVRSSLERMHKYCSSFLAFKFSADAMETHPINAPKTLVYSRMCHKSSCRKQLDTAVAFFIDTSPVGPYKKNKHRQPAGLQGSVLFVGRQLILKARCVKFCDIIRSENILHKMLVSHLVPHFSSISCDVRVKSLKNPLG